MDGNFTDGQDIPIGFGMALAQNSEAMEHFAKLPDKAKQDVINGTHSVRSRNEMKAYVDQLL